MPLPAFSSDSRLAATLLLVLGYAASGWAALWMVAPGGYAAPLFPAAGIALSMLMIHGRQLWPGVLLGSALVQILAAPELLQDGRGMAGTLMVPLGATLQALGGLLLAERLVGLPNGLDTPRAVSRFLTLVAPLSCLINASLSTVALTLAGAITPASAAFTWWNWWIGDTLGVLIATPLMFVFFGLPRSDWASRRRAVALPLLGALALLATAFVQVREWEAQRLQDRFNRDAEHFASLLRERLRTQAEMLQSLERLMSVSEHVSRADFRDFVSAWLQRYPAIQNFGWSPLVTREQRAAHEAHVSADGLPGYTILARDAEGGTRPSPPQDEYLPITYVEPVQGNERVLGLNPLSLPHTAEPIMRSRISGRPSASAGIRLVQEQGGQRSVVVYQWVEPRAGGLPSVGEGLLSTVMRMDDLVFAAVSSVAHLPVELCLSDASATPAQDRLAGPPGCDSPGWSAHRISHTSPLPFADRDWRLHLRATSAYVSEQAGWAGWATLAVGGLAAGILGAFLLLTSGRTRRVEAQVFRRTAQLSAAQERLRKQQNALAQAQRIARVGSWEWNPGSGELNCSRELQRLLGGAEGYPITSLDELLLCLHPEDRPHLALALEETRHGAGCSLDCRLLPGPEGERVARFAIEPDPSLDPLPGLRGTVQDITAARQAQQHIHYLAHYDPLTGLPNRLLWRERAEGALAMAVRHHHQMAVLFLDLDQFKNINDSLGHGTGDRLLTGVAERLRGALREEDVLARLGGDEFALLLPQLEDGEDASGVALKLLQALSPPFTLEHHELSISVSIGIATFPTDGADVDTLLKHADTAMYGAKEAGRNNYQFFTPEMNVRALQRLMMENALRRGIERNELRLEYQAQVDARHGHLVGCEALVRWQHPDLGMVSPVQFIPVAEAGGIIVPLGNWVLREACRQQVQWREAHGRTVSVAVNISALQFQRATFVSEVRQILHDTGADPRCIELELTESALTEPTEPMLQRLEALRELGLSLALDDFGTGYSCLAYLKRLPIARLKLDRSFVKDLPADAEDAAIASATLSIARELGLEVVAEGVETREQQSFLAERGCEYLQGYLFSRPLPPEAFAGRYLEADAPAAASCGK